MVASGCNAAVRYRSDGNFCGRNRHPVVNSKQGFLTTTSACLPIISFCNTDIAVKPTIKKRYKHGNTATHNSKSTLARRDAARTVSEAGCHPSTNMYIFFFSTIYFCTFINSHWQLLLGLARCILAHTNRTIKPLS